ncbi:phosphotransferase [Niallia sp. Krafla_26]|uniref:phosphotransferase n=1 Tax=Niallia sp. Krafla_26 TaxID=3064703 RepID=UPI003D16405D
MNRLNKIGGDEEFNHRLLSYLKKQLSTNIQQFTHIKKNVYFIKMEDGTPIIVKGFSSRRSLLIQDAFTSSLKKNHFHSTYMFYQGMTSLQFNKKYYGLLEYINPSKQRFLYNSMENCQEAMSLLQKYHQTSKKLVGSYRRLLPSFDLQNKWEERFFLFLKNEDILSYFIPREIVSELISWAEWSLKGLKKEKESLFRQPVVILHGDVAHHNFLRKSNGDLYLIDFDLISVGPVFADYVQYANRILPFLNWSLPALNEFPIIQPYFQQKLFLYALAYPTDIFREWNRLIKEQSHQDLNKIRNTLQLTFSQFDQRQEFVRELMRIVK